MRKHAICSDCGGPFLTCQQVYDHFGKVGVGKSGEKQYCPLCWWTAYLGKNITPFRAYLRDAGLTLCSTCVGETLYIPLMRSLPLILQGEAPMDDPPRLGVEGFTWLYADPTPLYYCDRAGAWKPVDATLLLPKLDLGDLRCMCNTCHAMGY